MLTLKDISCGCVWNIFVILLLQTVMRYWFGVLLKLSVFLYPFSIPVAEGIQDDFETE